MADINDVDARSWEKIIHRMRQLEREVENVNKLYQQALTRSTGRHVYIGKATEDVDTVEENESTFAATGRFQPQEVTADGIVRDRGPIGSFFNLSEKITSGDLLPLIRDPFSGRMVSLLTAKGLELFPFTLTEDMGETTPNTASANLLEWDFTTVDGDPVTIIDPAENYGFAKTDAKGIATKISRVINEGSESEETITEYHIVELVPPLAEAKVAKINIDLEPWDNEEFVHGCETQSGTIVEPCEAEEPEEPETVDLVFIRREGREPDLKAGDRIQCVPLDLTADPPKYLAVGEYLKGGEAEYFGVVLLEDVGETTANNVSAGIYEMDFTTVVESTANVKDNGGIFDGGLDGAKGIAVKVEGVYHLIQLGCKGSS